MVLFSSILHSWVSKPNPGNFRKSVISVDINNNSCIYLQYFTLRAIWCIYTSFLCPSFQCGGWHQALRHLQDCHRLWICRALQSVLVPQRPSAPLQKRVLGPTQRPAECKSSLPGPGPLSEPEPAPQMNYPPAVYDTNQGGDTKFSLLCNGERVNLWTMLVLV